MEQMNLNKEGHRIQNKAKKELSIILVLVLITALLSGCSDITKISLNANGSGRLEETTVISKDFWDLALSDAGDDDVIRSYLNTLYPQAEIEISDQTIDGTASKVIELKMNFSDVSEFTQALSAMNTVSVKFNNKYFTRAPIYMPLEGDESDETSAAEELQTLLGSDENLIAAIDKELQNMNIRTTITFPYTIADTNGTMQEDGKTVVWDLQKMGNEKRLFALFQISDSSKSPVYTGAANGKNYNTGVTLMIDSENLLSKVTVNGETTESDYLFLSAEGIHNITATDVNGNSRKIKFRIDTTKPSVKGISNGKTYKTARTIKFSDKGSGIKKAVLNGKSIKTGKKITKKGTYTFVVTDRAGNKKTVKFKIK